MDEEILYCSECGKEVSGSDKTCPHCGVELEETSGDDNFNIVTAAMFYTDIDAEIAKERLEEAGIECYLQGNINNSMEPVLTFAQGMGLMVQEKDFEKAVALLKELKIID
ncbi:MAG: DUF2007 domain-containing protein [Ignavibacteria bacterium]|nr:DUF2007 domain-containing protein [Ignavibacteria bacterium]